ncbi:hypothetical protein NEI00_07165 [Brachyspira pilosicoli]|uniref:hypothetical protein n=1 Tax=Brachyspira pilosicoli TaxID=52584 RepID=UPI002542DAD9|nr:hypothetical protein [Brachyspira pilosicoli]WIH82783.1 hypothetical protein NEI00_07165 [Brachyspira pilosicoli]
MSKRVLRLVSILFLSSILVLSCSNANKTGSGDNNSGNGGSGTGGDGGTTPTPEGIAKYAGTWTAKFTDSSGGISTYYVIIGSDKTVTIKDTAGEIKAENITESGNTYTMTVKHGSEVDASIVTITFDSVTSGTINDDTIGNGVIRKQNNGNKGLWYYEGTWTLTANQQPAQAAPNPTITIGNDGSVTYSNEKSTDVTDKGNETYEVKFTPEGEGESIITLKFTDDSNGSFTLSTGSGQSGSGTLTKKLN